MDDMKISFKVEITGCSVGDKHCPYVRQACPMRLCAKDPTRSNKTVAANKKKLTKTCPMVRAQFEALE